MQIQLPPETEQLIIAAFQAGDFDRVADELASAVRDNGATIVVSADASEERDQSWKEFESEIDIDELATRQGVGPLKNAKDLIFPGWPEGESVDEFIAAAKGYDLPNASP